MKHRRILKGALIALLIVLSLVLGGCYVGTDDISTSGQGNDPINFPEYQGRTNPPIPTNPPTNAPVVSLNTPSAGVISLPTSVIHGNVWTIAPLNSATPGGAAVVTPPPFTASPSPTPQGSLKLGSTGQEVRNVQQKLKSLGFLKGSVDGDFGEATEAAVKAFQQQYGLTVDGKVGPATLAKLAAARQTAKPAATPTKKPTATPSYSANTFLRKGSSGSQVRQMQNRLIALGYLSGTATGNFDDATERAVFAFQRRNTSYADGVAGPETLKALYSSSARSTSTASAIIGTTLKAGSEGAAVRTLQTRLKELGYYKGTVDGDYGTGTTEAVKAFQRGNNLNVDGVAGGGTLNKLFSSSAKQASAVASTPTKKPTAAPYVTPTPIPSGIYIQVTPAPLGQYATLRRGNYGSPVQQMQQALKDQGYYIGSVDGYFGEGTENAVKAFQRANNLNVDGVAGPATLHALIDGIYPYGS